MKCGPMNMLYTLVSNIDMSQYSISIITLKPEPVNSLKPQFEELGIRVYNVGRSNSHLLLGLKDEIKEALNIIDADIVHAHGLWPDYYSRYIDAVPTVVSVHNKLKEDYVPLYGTLVGSAITILDARSMRKASLAISVSDSVANVAASRYKIKSKVIVNGVDIAKYSPADSSLRMRLREALGIHAAKYVFLHIGNMIERKKPFILADAFRIAQETNPDMELHFLGDGPLLEECVNRYSGLSNIVFHGNVDNVRDYMRAADCMVSATASDGMSMATLEGLACGLRGVMSDIDVHHEIKQKFNVPNDDFVIVDADPNEYAEAYLQMSRMPNRRNDVDKTLLSGKRMADQYIEEYRLLFA